MKDEELRKRVRILKATKAIDNYYEIAEFLEITEKSFYNWLSAYYTLSDEKKKLLNLIIDDLTLSE